MFGLAQAVQTHLFRKTFFLCKSIRFSHRTSRMHSTDKSKAARDGLFRRSLNCNENLRKAIFGEWP